MPVPFGFSVGDCISVCLLIKDMIKALDTIKGSKAEYQAVVGELWTLHWALLEVERLQNSTGQGRTKEVTALCASVGACRGCLEGFLQRIRRYEETLGENDGRGIANSWKEIKGKVSWALLRREDLTNFRAEINAHSMTINMMLITANMSLTQLNGENIQDCLDEARRANGEELNKQLVLLGQVKEIAVRLADSMRYFMSLGSELKAFMRSIWTLSFRSYNILLEFQTRVPREFGPCFIQEPLILTDALGRVAPIHLEFINSWDVLESALEARFRGLPGERKIRQREYALQDRSSQLDIARSASFESSFLPGRMVDMSMVFRHSNSSTTSCPGCGMETARQNTTAAACEGCGIWFQRIEELIEHGQDSSPQPFSSIAKPKSTTPWTPIQRSGPGPSKSEAIRTKRVDAYLDERMALFKRVRLLHRNHTSSRKTRSIFPWTMTFVIYKYRLFAVEDQVAQEKANNDRIHRELPDHLLQTRSFLQLAALNGDQEAVRTLISQGESVHAVNTVDTIDGRRGEPPYRIYPMTALHAAVEGGHNKIVDYLLSSGSDPNSDVDFWGTPLVIAVRKHSTDMADTLLRWGADVNQIASNRTNALQRASHEGNLAMVNLLLEYGANVNGRPGVWGMGPAIVAAAANDNARVIERLLDEGADINAVQWYNEEPPSQERQTALVRAISMGFDQVVDMLLKRGADIHMDCERGNAVQNAAYFGREEIFNDLLARGADPYQQTKSFANVLEAAVAGGQGRMFQKLLALGMDIHFDCTGAGTLLHVAAMSGEDSIVRYLLDWIDVNQEGGVFGTALIAAASRGNTSTCQLLIARGADLLIQSDRGCPMHRAAQCNNVEIVNLLLGAGTPIDKPTHSPSGLVFNRPSKFRTSEEVMIAPEGCFLFGVPAVQMGLQTPVFGPATYRSSTSRLSKRLHLQLNMQAFDTQREVHVII